MEEILLNSITEDEYRIMDNYRYWYGWNEDKTSNCESISIREILNGSWARANHNLYKLLGNNLKISKEFNYEKSPHELERELIKMIDEQEAFGRLNRQGYEFIKNFSNWYKEYYAMPDTVWNSRKREYEYPTKELRKLAENNAEIRHGLACLINYRTLSTNNYDGANFSIEFPDGKVYKVNYGCKPMRVLSKIADAFNIEGFEDFRICHSLIHNQKKVSGTITLSIHPLDYWTMSDNDCGWDSCMNWRDWGSYRQGTIEMMNSPSVIVAYMEASEPMLIGKDEWNNKRWRQLFIVDEGLILGIKSYPYRNDMLTDVIIKWLRDLAYTNLGWTYFGDKNNDIEPIKYNFEPFYNPNYIEDSRPIYLDFCSDMMYTDVGCLDWHALYVGTNVCEANMDKYNGKYIVKNNISVIYLDYNYSGDSQCISCGSLTNNFEGEGCLCCCDCQKDLRCYECDDYLDYDNAYNLHGHYLCEYCWDKYVRDCMVCGDSEFKSDMCKIEIYIPISEDYQKELQKIRGCHISEDDYEIKSYFWEPTYVCFDHKKQFERDYLINNAEIKQYTMFGSYGLYYNVSVADINLEEDAWEGILPYDSIERIKEAQKSGEYDELAKYYMDSLEVKKVKPYNSIPIW